MRSILIQSVNEDPGKKAKETQNRKPLVALFDIPGIQSTYSIPGPTQGTQKPGIKYDYNHVRIDCTGRERVYNLTYPPYRGNVLDLGLFLIVVCTIFTSV